MIIRAKLQESKRIYRDIYVDSKTKLDDLAAYILYAFDFDLDHLYGFFQSPDVYGKGMEMNYYEASIEVDKGSRSVSKTATAKLFKAKKDKWWMLFDYGDDWIFELECIDPDNNKGQFENGTVIKTAGVAPKQYDFEDDME